MWQRSVHAKLRKTSGAEKHFREQSEHSNAARFSRDASIDATPGCLKGVTGNVPVTAEEAAGTLPEIGNDNNVGIIITRSGFQPRLPLSHIIRRSEVCVPVTTPDLQTTEFVDQKEVDHAGNGVGAIHSRRAILQDVDVINHHEGKEVDIRSLAGPGDAQRTKGDTFSIDQHQGFLAQQAARVELDSTVTTIADVEARSCADVTTPGQKTPAVIARHTPISGRFFIYCGQLCKIPREFPSAGITDFSILSQAL